MPFHGMLSDEMTKQFRQLDSKEVLISWLPAWWFSLAVSFSMAGMGIGCAIWATINQINDQPTATPFLLGCSALVASFGGILVPIAQAFFKDRSESRRSEELQNRVKELETMVSANRVGHLENAINIQKIADAAEKMVEAKEAAKSVPPE